jgi:hypothetical protein
LCTVEAKQRAEWSLQANQAPLARPLKSSKPGVEGRGGACNDASKGVRETGDAGPKGEGERDMEETSAPRERERADRVGKPEGEYTSNGPEDNVGARRKDKYRA